MTETIKFGKEAKDIIKQGANKITEAMAQTLGPGGKNVLIYDKSRNSYTITKDGVTVGNSISFDGYDKIGSDMIKMASNKTNKEVGDNTTTTAIITNALINELINVENSPETKRILDFFRGKIIEYIDSKKLAIDDRLSSVINISTNGDSEITSNIIKAFGMSNENRKIVLKEGVNSNTVIKSVDGISLKNGVYDKNFFNIKDGYKEENGLIFLFKNKIEKMDQIKNALSFCADKSVPILILAPDFDVNVLNLILTNIYQNRIKGCCIKVPYFGESQKEYIETLKVALGIEFSDELKPHKFDDTFVQYSSISATDSYSDIVVDINKESISLLNEYKKKLTNPIKKLTDNEISRINANIDVLSGNIVTIEVGGSSILEIQEKIDRYDDAICSAKNALEGGVVAGGGHTLYECSTKILETENPGFNETLYNSIRLSLYDVLAEPIYMIHCNLNGCFEEENYTATFDELINKGIIDPANATKCVINNAFDTCGIFMTTNCIVVNE